MLTVKLKINTSILIYSNAPHYIDAVNLYEISHTELPAKTTVLIKEIKESVT